MPKRQFTAVLLCGGTGTRLWPLSRETFPKQFLALFGEKSLFQQTVLRVSDRNTFDPPMVFGKVLRFRSTMP